MKPNEQIDTIRDYIELVGSHEGVCDNEGNEDSGPCYQHIEMEYKRRLAASAALDQLAAESKQEPSEDVRVKIFNPIGEVHDPSTLLKNIRKRVIINGPKGGYRGDTFDLSDERAAALIIAHDATIEKRVREECDSRVQETLTMCGVSLSAGIRQAIKAAILRKEDENA